MTDYSKFRPVEPTELMVRWHGYPEFKQRYEDWKEAWFHQREATGNVGYEKSREIIMWERYAKNLQLLLDRQNARLLQVEKERDLLLYERNR